MYKMLSEEEQYYKDYEWCLDPLRRWVDLRQRLDDELTKWVGCANGWQERETALNCWLMACALWQARADYLVRGSGAIGGGVVSVRMVELMRRAILPLAELFIDLRNRIFDLPVVSDDASWRNLLVDLSRGIMGEKTVVPAVRERIQVQVRSLLWRAFPRGMLEMHVSIPDAFRSQDLTHHDMLRLVNNFANGQRDFDAPVLIVGLRTTGAYFAPLARACLEHLNFASVDFITIRPHAVLSSLERDALRRAVKQNARFLIVDEVARTGTSLRETMRIVRQFGARNSRISLAFPVYPAHTRWKHNLRDQQIDGVQIYTLSWSYWHLTERMKPENVKMILQDYYEKQDLHLVNVDISLRGKTVDDRFGQLERIGWRLKQVYRVRLWDRNGKEHFEDVVAKGVGWGWLGYHAYIEGCRLKDFVPPVLGLRSGLLFMKWIDGVNAASAGVSARKIMPDALKYIFERINKFPLTEDGTFRRYSRHYYGGQLLCSVLSRGYGRRLGLLARPLIRRLLLKHATPHPSVIDGKMSPREWILSNGRFWKTDFEHHGFGRMQLNIADPVFDLASYIFEFRLSCKEMDDAIKYYCDYTNDSRVKERVVLYIWLIGHHNIADVKAHLSEPYLYTRTLRENEKFVCDRNYGSRFSVEYLSRMMQWPRKKNRGATGLIVDFDGLLNRDVWEFPVLTTAGVKTLLLLHNQGYPLFVRSSASIEEVRHYCDYCCIDGGIAEHGAVLWDSGRRLEISLINDKTRRQMEQIKTLLLELPGLYIDSGYRYVVKAFQYRENGTVSVSRNLIETLIAEHRLDELVIVQGEWDTAVLPRQGSNERHIASLLQTMVPGIGRIQNYKENKWLADNSFHIRKGLGRDAVAERREHLLVTIMRAADRPRWARLFSIINPLLLESHGSPGGGRITEVVPARAGTPWNFKEVAGGRVIEGASGPAWRDSVDILRKLSCRRDSTGGIF
jgi:orotate phosphoribosyltransferase